MNLSSYRALGRSGLVVSPIALGTMTFGTGRWGADRQTSRAIFDGYVEAGGNFIDTADVYANGTSEEMLGSFIADTQLRDRVVLATKAGFPFNSKHPLAGGNGAKHVQAALERSLLRLATDYVDLYWVHVWDQVTPVEDVLGTLAGLVAAGKIRYFGLSNVPAWYAAKMSALAVAHALPQPIALQFAYSLLDRGIEYEHIAMARDCGMSMVPWSPLGGGFLSGKYDRETVSRSPAVVTALPSVTEHAGSGDIAEGRLNGPNPFGDRMFTDRNWAILDVVRAIAHEIGKSPAQLALAWVAARPGVGSTLIGASRPEQLASNIASLDITLSADQLERLETASAPAALSPFSLFSPYIRNLVFASSVTAWGE